MSARHRVPPPLVVRGARHVLPPALLPPHQPPRREAAVKQPLLTSRMSTSPQPLVPPLFQEDMATCLWCLDCAAVATADCVDYHHLMSVKGALRQQVRQLLDAVPQLQSEVERRLQHLVDSGERVLDALRFAAGSSVDVTVKQDGGGLELSAALRLGGDSHDTMEKVLKVLILLLVHTGMLQQQASSPVSEQQGSTLSPSCSSMDEMDVDAEVQTTVEMVIGVDGKPLVETLECTEAEEVRRAMGLSPAADEMQPVTVLMVVEEEKDSSLGEFYTAQQFQPMDIEDCGDYEELHATTEAEKFEDLQTTKESGFSEELQVAEDYEYSEEFEYSEEAVEEYEYVEECEEADECDDADNCEDVDGCEVADDFEDADDSEELKPTETWEISSGAQSNEFQHHTLESDCVSEFHSADEAMVEDLDERSLHSQEELHLNEFRHSAGECRPSGMLFKCGVEFEEMPKERPASTWMFQQLSPAGGDCRIDSLDVDHLSEKPADQAQVEKEALLEEIEQFGVRRLTYVQCKRDPAWSLRLLQRAAPRLEELELVCGRGEHLAALRTMPRLRRLQLVADSATLPTLRVPRHELAGLRWLRAWGMTRDTTLHLLSEHGPSLQCLELYAGTPASSPAAPLEGATPSDLQEGAWPTVLPGHTSPSDLPEGAWPTVLPGRTSPSDLPEGAWPTVLPGRTSPSDLPEGATIAVLPECASPTVLRKPATPSDLPEISSHTVLPEAATLGVFPEGNSPRVVSPVDAVLAVLREEGITPDVVASGATTPSELHEDEGSSRDFLSEGGASPSEVPPATPDDWPLSCPDLHAVLEQCGLRSLRLLVLRRFCCSHTADLCRLQVDAVHAALGPRVEVLCDVCDRIPEEDF